MWIACEQGLMLTLLTLSQALAHFASLTHRIRGDFLLLHPLPFGPPRPISCRLRIEDERWLVLES